MNHTPAPWSHTPAPWITVDNYKQKVFAQTPKGLMTICDIRGWGHLTGGGAMGLSPEEAVLIQDANATLIALAPELLNELKDLTDRFVLAAVLAGTDKEFAEIAVTRARTLVALAGGTP